MGIFFSVWFVAIVFGIIAGYVSLKITSENKGFVFGIHTNAFVANTIGDPYQPDNVDKALKLAKQLGVQYLRINFEGQGLYQASDDLIDRVLKADLKPVLIVESSLPAAEFFAQESYQRGFQLGQEVASHYRSQVRYFQLANEVSGMTIKPLHTGEKIQDYDPQKYLVLKNWIKGLSDGIKEGNSKAKRVVSSNWIATAVIDELIKDGVEFEIIGWNWFSDMGEDPTYKVLDDGTVLDIPGHFAKTGKQFWFVELNRAAGSYKNAEIDQAQFLRRFWNNIKKSKDVDGLFGYTLVDFAPHLPDEQRLWGFASVKRVAGTKRFTIGGPKPVFYEYQEIIKNPNF